MCTNVFIGPAVITVLPVVIAWRRVKSIVIKGYR